METRGNRLMVIALAAAILLLLTGCAPTDQLDQIMGRTDGTAIPAPAPKLDCDLIFPPAAVNP
jgi:hypothetical protein